MKTRAFSIIEIFIICIIVLLLALIAGGAWDKMKHQDERERFTFAAWEKQTGNPRHLSFEEWRSLAKMNEPAASQIIIIPH